MATKTAVLSQAYGLSVSSSSSTVAVLYADGTPILYADGTPVVYA